MAIIDSSVNGKHETQVFIETAYKVYIDRRVRYELDRGTIDAYLDAKAESDYLEMRGVKLAVALEKLKSVFSKLPHNMAKELVLDETVFDGLMPKIKNAISEVLKEAGVDGSVRGEIYGKLRSLNYRSFADLLKDVFLDIEFDPTPTDTKLFIRCRNKLVHTGNFYCIAATPKEKAECKPLSSPAEEYYFMVNFLDKIFLRLLGYRGPYRDYRTLVPGPIEKRIL
jgi:hypothetical protein